MTQVDGDCKRIRSQTSLELCQPLCKGFDHDIEVIPVLTDDEYLDVHK
ncbi:hypothetical protein [Prochlorococcus marinus]|nr:hypothetical protein [Prochlorococcus marinus]